jgi:hypothetical protein
VIEFNDNFKKLFLVDSGKPLIFVGGYRFKDTGYWLETVPNFIGSDIKLHLYIQPIGKFSEIKKKKVEIRALMGNSVHISIVDGQFDNLPPDLQEFLIFNLNYFT